MFQLPEYLDRGDMARLFPVVADTSKERRAASIFLSTLMTVKDFSNVLLGTIGQRVGALTRIECFTETVFKNVPSEGERRPDGLIQLKVGRRTWTALVEAKIGRAKLEKEQLQAYAKLSKMNGLNAVITLSNEFVALPTHHPVSLPKKALQGIGLYHWSWMYVVTQATLLLADDEFTSPEQRYILSEMVRYFTHESTGVSSFDRMNPEWKGLVITVQSGGTLNKNSSEVEKTIASWHQEQRDLCLTMSRELDRQAKLKISRAHASDPSARLKDDCEELARTTQLRCEMVVPDAAAPITITADLKTRHISCAMRIAAPEDRKTTKARVNWLVRQLNKTDPENVLIKALWPKKAQSTMASLEEVRANPMSLQAENPTLTPKHFDVVMVRDLAGKFSGSKTFIEQLEEVVPRFYDQVGQYLRPWVPPPPKPRERAAIEAEKESSDGSETLAP